MAAQASVSLEKAKRREPDKASIREALGIAYFRMQRYQEAESEFRVMVDLSPADDYAHYGLARCLEKLGRNDEARGHYKLANRSGRTASTTHPGCGRSTTSDGVSTGLAASIAALLSAAMRAVVQRVSQARVVVAEEVVGEIGLGLCVLLGVARGDEPRTPSGSPAVSRAFGSSRTSTGSSTAACSTRAARRSSSASSR